MNKFVKFILFNVLVLIFVSQGSLMAQEGEPFPPQNTWQPFIMVGVAMLFFYFILWRPEQKRRKALEELRSTLKKGDRVTVMGILGIVHRIQDQTVIVKMFDGGKIEVLKGVITDVTPGSEADAD